MFHFKYVSFVLCVVLSIACGVAECKPDAPAKKEKKVVISKVEQEIDKSIMNMEITLKDGPDGISVVDLDAELFIDIPNDLYGTNVISKKSGQTEYKPLIKSGRINMCEYFKNPDKEPILKLLLARLNTFGHMMFDCPVKKDKYYLKGFFMDSATVPSFAPPGDYKLDFAIFRKEKDTFTQVFKMTWYATISLK